MTKDKVNCRVCGKEYFITANGNGKYDGCPECQCKACVHFCVTSLLGEGARPLERYCSRGQDAEACAVFQNKAEQNRPASLSGRVSIRQES